MILKLKNNAEYTILENSTPTLFCGTFPNWEQAGAFAAALTKENLEEYIFLSDEGQVYGSYPLPDGDLLELDRIELARIVVGWYMKAYLKNRDLTSERLENVEETVGMLVLDSLGGV